MLLATSRWLLPNWNGEALPLAGLSKGDFLTLAQALAERGRLNPLLLNRERINAVYQALGHNPRGLEWYAAATQTMNPQDEAAFTGQLAQTGEDLRLNMALEETLRRLPPAALSLLRRLPAYEAPVPAEGIIKVGLDLPNPPAALDALLNFSLLEVSENYEYQTLEYQTEPSLLAYLREKALLDEDSRWRSAAADFLLWLMKTERNTYPHLALTIQALRRAARHEEADRLTLDILVGKYTLDGRYADLLARWLPPVCESPDPQTRAIGLGWFGRLQGDIGTLDYLQRALLIRQQIGDRAGQGTTLNNISQIYHARGDYDTALDYLQRALLIRQQIGDRAGQGATLNNISQIYDARGDYDTALDYLQRALLIRQQIGDRAGLCATLFNIGHLHAQKGEMQQAVSEWVTSYGIAKQIGYAQVLQALANLAPQLGLPEGLEGWERLAGSNQ